MSDNIDSPNSQSCRSMGLPCNRIVQGSESEMIAASPPAAVSGESSPQSMATIEQTASGSPSSTTMSIPSSPPPEDDKSDNGVEARGDAGKRPVWNRPVNGGAEVGPIMGAVAWPALSESIRTPSIKSSSSSSVPLSQGTAISSASTQKHGNHTNSNSGASHSRQRSINNRSGTTPSSNGSLNGSLPHGSPIEGPLSNPSSGHNQSNGIVPQSHGGNNNHNQRNSNRNQNGNHLQNHGGRRGQDHGNNNWIHRQYNGRDGYPTPYRAAGFMRNPAPLIPPPFVPVHFMQPFNNFAVYPEVVPPFHYGPLPPFGPVPFVPPLPGPLPHQVQDLYTRLINQIHYYFSEDNLVRDYYLRQHMDEQGFVKIQLIAGFKRVSELTNNIPLILDALRNSPVVEVQGENIRKRNGWSKYLVSKPARTALVSSPRSEETSNQNVATTQLENLSLEQDATDQTGMNNNSSNGVLPQASTSRSTLDGSNAQPEQSSTDRLLTPVFAR